MPNDYTNIVYALPTIEVLNSVYVVLNFVEAKVVQVTKCARQFHETVYVVSLSCLLSFAHKTFSYGFTHRYRSFYVHSHNFNDDIQLQAELGFDIPHGLLNASYHLLLRSYTTVCNNKVYLQTSTDFDVYSTTDLNKLFDFIVPEAKIHQPKDAPVVNGNNNYFICFNGHDFYFYSMPQAILIKQW